jgi:hypothetical protein
MVSTEQVCASGLGMDIRAEELVAMFLFHCRNLLLRSCHLHYSLPNSRIRGKFAMDEDEGKGDRSVGFICCARATALQPRSKREIASSRSQQDRSHKMEEKTGTDEGTGSFHLCVMASPHCIAYEDQHTRSQWPDVVRPVNSYGQQKNDLMTLRRDPRPNSARRPSPFPPPSPLLPNGRQICDLEPLNR